MSNNERMLGRLPAVEDKRVPRLSVIKNSLLETPPDNIVWYADVPEWQMLGNNKAGNCVEAASLHAIQQFSDYAGDPVIPLESEALDFYTKSQGYDPTNPATDNGSITLGPSGTMQYWHDTGIMCAGKLNKVQAYLQITKRDPLEWRQAIWVFGGLLIGMKVPDSIVNAAELPFVWDYQQGAAIAGLHEVWANGVVTVAGERFYDIVTWGQHCRLTEQYMVQWLDEAIVLFDAACLDTSGCDARGLSAIELVSLMSDLR